MILMQLWKAWKKLQEKKMNNMNEKIVMLADSLADCVLFSKVVKPIKVKVKTKDNSRKFKMRRIASKKVYGF